MELRLALPAPACPMQSRVPPWTVRQDRQAQVRGGEDGTCLDLNRQAEGLQGSQQRLRQAVVTFQERT
ncbi:MAG: hypothetical protein Q7T47_03195, partial [Anaerolineales bacterium]|nr:hypothetical protein [Anaerolineales bacterium]